MNEHERACCLAIEFPQVNYLPGSWSKRFSRDMGARARDLFGNDILGSSRLK